MDVKLKRVNGALKIDVNGEIIEPLSFKSFRPTKRNISDFYKAGVRAFSILSSGLNSILKAPYSLFGESWIGNEKYDFEKIDNQIDLFLENAPDAYFALMLQVDTRSWYLEENPGCPDSFRYLSQTACSDKWREAAGKYIRAAIEHVEEKYGERFYGYFLLGGTTTEWFSEYDYEENHPFKLEAYKKYMGEEDVCIPRPFRRELDSNISFVENEDIYTRANKSNVITYRKFHANVIADTILYFAKIAKEATGRKKLVGVYFGYLFELFGPRLWDAGHLGYEKVFTSDDIDMISSPSSYLYRNYDDCSQFMVTYDTLNKHNKLYYLEFDHITHIAPTHIDGNPIPGRKSHFSTDEETIDVMRRDFMLCLAKGAALWWFDMFEGWFYSDKMMSEVKNMIEIQKNAPKAENVSEIAVIVSVDSLYHTNKNSKINNEFFLNQRKGLSYMCAPYDVYSMCDFPEIDFDKYKLFIFLDAFKISSLDRKIIDEKVKVSGKSALWFYAPAYITDSGFDVSGISEITGMNIKISETEEKEITCGKSVFGGISSANPTFYVDDDRAKTLGTYVDSGKTGFAVKEINGFKSFYCARGNMSASVLREVANKAGVRVYCDSDTAMYISGNVIGVYTDKETEIFVDNGKYIDAFSKKEYICKNGVIKLEKENKRSKLLIKQI